MAAITSIRKRDGRIVSFDIEKIAGAIDKAFGATYKNDRHDVAEQYPGIVEELATKLDAVKKGR